MSVMITSEGADQLPLWTSLNKLRLRVFRINIQHTEGTKWLAFIKLLTTLFLHKSWACSQLHFMGSIIFWHSKCTNMYSECMNMYVLMDDSICFMACDVSVTGG